jgi:predicted MFS family arabinose efflux permease
MIGLVNPKKRSVASASYYSFVELGSAIGAPLLGLAAENFGYTVMFRAGACVALLYIILYIAIGREKKTRDTQVC